MIRFSMVAFVMCASFVSAATPEPKKEEIKPVPIVDRTPSIVTLKELEQIPAGTVGYGLTVIKGTEPVKFSFVIDGIIENFVGYRHLLMVHLTSEPFVSGKDGLVSGTGVVAGMSGSPMYLKDGRLIGALIMAFGGQRNGAITFIGLAEDMIAMRKRIANPPAPFPEKRVAPGASVAVCTVWGELEDCGHSTAVFDDGQYLFLTGHEASSASIGSMRGHLFEASVIGSAAFFSGDMGFKLYPRLGAPLGTVIYNGWHGQLARAEISDGIPVTVSVVGLGGETIRRSCRMASSASAAPDLGVAVRRFFGTLGVDDDANRTSAHIVSKDKSTSDYEDAPVALLISVAKRLRKELANDPEDSPVISIDITLTVAKKSE